MAVRELLNPRANRGAALLLMLALSGLLAVLIVVNLLPARPVQLERERSTQEALAKAKDALIAYVVANVDRFPNEAPGRLPCPELAAPTIPNDEGYSPLECGAQNVSAVGRLPWKTLDVEPIRDAHGECLWYVVAGNFKRSGAGGKLVNWDTLGQFVVLAPDGVTRVAGATSDSLAAAIIVSPGAALQQQSRAPAENTPSCPGSHAADQYLEAVVALSADNASPANTLVTPTNSVGGGNSTLINGYVDPNTGTVSVNDQMIVITPKEIFDAIEKRKSLVGTAVSPGILRTLTRRVAECMAEFPSDAYPPATGTDRRMIHAATMQPADFQSDASYTERDRALEGRVPARAYTSVLGTSLNPAYIETHCSHWAEIQFLFQHWKDHLFYALSDEFSQLGSSSNTQCSGTCLSVNGAGQYPGLVLFAGRRLAALNQMRVLSTERRLPSSYLEGLNLARLNVLGSGTAYESTAESANFNDVVYCIQFQTVGSDSRVPKVDPC